MKECTKCSITKPFAEFHKHKGRKDGHSDQCSEKVVYTHIVSDEVEVVIEPEVEEVLTEIIEDLKVAEVVEDV